jgi:hypothetical protein
VVSKCSEQPGSHEPEEPSGEHGSKCLRSGLDAAPGFAENGGMWDVGYCASGPVPSA